MDMDMVQNIILVFVTSIVELWLGIPIGLYLKLNPVLIAISAAFGSILSVFLIIVVGEGIRNAFIKWRGVNSPNEGRIYDIWNKYGIIGLGLLSPLFFGAPLGAALGIGLGVSKERLFFWMTIGIVIWSAFLTTAGYFGLISFQSLKY
jgi:Putative small multi-drug export protein